MRLTRPRCSQLVPAALAAAALVFLRFYHPPEDPVLLCGFRWLTSLPCPLCGMTRGLCAMAQGDWTTAVRLHALSPPAFALVLGMAASGPLRIAGIDASVPWERARFWTVAAWIVAGYGALRIASLTL